MSQNEHEIATENEASLDETDMAREAKDSTLEGSTNECPEVVVPVAASLQERFLRIKKMVKEAIDSHRTFMIYGKSRVIRECMLSRGWCEKFYRKPKSGERSIEIRDEQQRRQQGRYLRGRNNFIEDRTSCNDKSSPVGLLAGIGDLRDDRSERVLISRMLADVRVDFLWNSGSDWAGWPSRDNGATIFNRYCRAGFTSKVGLCSNVRQMHWYYEADVANTLFPRCYNICQADQMHAFIEDFRFTACLSLLKWLVDAINADGESAARSQNGTIPLKALDFAIRRCTDYIGARSHEDIDREVERVWSHQWDQFIRWYYKIVQGEALFVRNNVPFTKYFLASRHILKKIRKYWQQLDMDGISNIWILKPGNKSRGRGIVLVNKLEDVVARMNPANKTDTRYVVQKYIERPMLIYGTKFDIRQWFIVTCAQPLTLWMYRESYLRFCSQNFRLTDFHESIHLCNNAVQCKYKNSPDRDPALPVDNMWDSTTFKQFLKKEGHEDAWDRSIYPGMRQSLVGSLLASQEAMDRRKNSFELYGADFMLMEDFSVWLIEINSHPDMSHSSSVTTRLCKRVMEDTIKVVIDFRQDKKADTGLFELAYRQRMPSCQPYLGAALSLQGTRIITCERKQTNLGVSNLVTKSPIVSRGKDTANGGYIGPVIVDLIEELELQLDQEFLAYRNLEDTPRQNLSVASAPVESSASKNSLALVKSSETLNGNTVKSAEPSAPTSNTRNKSIDRGSLARRTTKSFSRGVATRNDFALTRQPNLISKIMELDRETVEASKSRKKSSMTRKTEEKVIDSAMRDAATKYKKYGTTNGSANLVGTTAGSSTVARTVEKSTDKPPRTRHRRSSNQRKKSRVLDDVNDMYAVGLGLTK